MSLCGRSWNLFFCTGKCRGFVRILEKLRVFCVGQRSSLHSYHIALCYSLEASEPFGTGREGEGLAGFRLYRRQSVVAWVDPSILHRQRVIGFFWVFLLTS